MADVNDSVPGTDQTDVILHCDITLDITYDTVIAGICVAMGLFGLVYTFVGYRCFKAVMFLSGLIFGGTVVFVLCQEEGVLQHSLSYEAIVGIAVGMGVLCGFITMLVRYVGLFLQGFFLGLLVAIGAILALQKFYHPSTPWIPVGILFGTGILFSLLTLKWQKSFVIISTSVMGAALICTCLEYFLEKFLLLRYIWKSLMAATTTSVCWYAWVVLGIWPVLSLLGCLVQWKFTAKGYDHTDVIIWRGQRKRVRTHLVRQYHRNQTPNALSEVCTPVEPGLPRSNSRSSNAQRPTDRVGRAEGRDPQRRPVPPTSANFDTLPPSYNDCVERGVGRPVSKRDQSRIVRTKHGSFLAPAGQRPQHPSPNTARENEQGECSTPASRSAQRSSSDQARTRGSSQARQSPVRNSGRGRGNRRRGQESNPGGAHGDGPSARGRGSPSSRSSSQSRGRRGGNASWSAVARNRQPRDDRQLLLSSDPATRQNVQSQNRQPTPNEAVAAHARRLRAIQQRHGNNV